MIIALGANHGGFALKRHVITAIESSGNHVLGLGTHDKNPVDYPDYAKSVAEALVNNQAQREILYAAVVSAPLLPPTKLAISGPASAMTPVPRTRELNTTI